MLLVIVDEASNYMVAVPLDAAKMPTWDEVKRALEIGWLAWAGVPEHLVFDPARPHISEAAARFCAEQGCTGQPAPAEDHNANAMAENRINLFKAHFMRVNAEVQLKEEDDAWSWAGKIAAAQNQHLRYGGFSPNQYVFGRDPRCPVSLLTDEGRLTAQMAALRVGSGAARANEIRRAAVEQFFAMDDVRAIARSLNTRVRLQGDWKLGGVVYYWRVQGAGTMARRAMREAGWRGPCVIVAMQGTSKIYLATWGAPVLVGPTQLRAASEDEIGVLDNL